MKLYEITENYMNLLYNDELTDEEKQEVAKGIQKDLQVKSPSLIAQLQNMNNLKNGIDEEIKRLQDNKKALSNRIDSYKNYIKENMQTMNISKIETPLGNISIAKSPLSVEIIDQDKIPAKYRTIKQEEVIDKKAILNDFKETGEIIDGVRINTENTNLRIK